MERGERCSVLLRPDAAYGAAGCEAGCGGALGPTAAVPGDSVLHLDVELVGWVNTTDVSDSGDGRLLLKTLQVRVGEGVVGVLTVALTAALTAAFTVALTVALTVA